MSEDNLIRARMTRGDVTAFEQAYLDHFSCVRSFLRIYLGNAEATDDLVQETFLQLWRRPDAFDPARSSIKAYLLGIARKKAADWWRDLRHSPADTEQADSSTTQQSVLLRDVLNNLNSDLRNVLWLREVEGYSYEELAATLDIPVGTVRSRLFAAREQLRNIWNTGKEKNT